MTVSGQLTRLTFGVSDMFKVGNCLCEGGGPERPSEPEEGSCRYERGPSSLGPPPRLSPLPGEEQHST